MVTFLPVKDLGKLGALRPHQSLPAFDPSTCGRHCCDAHGVVEDEDVITARCSLWWNDAPPLPNERAGVIGHYGAADGNDAGKLLKAACNELRMRGCTVAVGPMDGNTWRRYRAVTERGVEPPFFLEPDNPDTWPGEWQAAGFEPLATYFSGLNPDLSRDDPQVTRAGERLMSRGMRLRTFDATDFEKELRIIYDLSVRCFTGNFLYTPISEAEFLAQYSAIREMIRPELVMIAEMDGEPVGFVFAIPDLLQKRRGAIDTVIVKTVAVLPERRCAGAGVWLVQEANRAARNLGYRRAIYALMHESNNSLNISARFGAPFRRYTLFARKLS